MLQAKLHLDPHFPLAEVAPEMFGSFLEHLGRAVYDGIYSPAHPSANKDGFRQDVIDLVRPLNIPLMRYPGGNFVSGYHWEDGVGPKESRPVRPDRAWRSLESNQVGLNEFSRWCRETGADMMLAVNLGTRGIDDACDLLEYCNHPGGTYFSDLRTAHGAAEPYNVRFWCLGNEMDGPWQIGHKTADEYGRLAAETARAMRRIDPDIRLIASGSSYPEMPTFPQWEATVLEHAYDEIDFLSLHQYLGDTTGNLQDYLAKSLTTEHFIHSVISTCDYIQAKKRSPKRMMLSFDEWNVWWRTAGQEDHITPWQHAPCLLEEIYTMADTAVFGTMLITLLNHADRIKIACLAQLVNVLAPIMTEPKGGRAWLQPIYWPFLHASRYGRGTVLRSSAVSPKYDSPNFTDVPYLESTAVYQEETGSLCVFAVNRSPDTPMMLDCDLTAFGRAALVEHTGLSAEGPLVTKHPDRQAIAPHRCVSTALKDDHLCAELEPLSWNVLRVQAELPPTSPVTAK